MAGEYTWGYSIYATRPEYLSVSYDKKTLKAFKSLTNLLKGKLDEKYSSPRANKKDDKRVGN